ncbi:transcriptional regulator [Methanocella sp. CWC-04]|uniref:Putative HTH-type transcriptional regulatory protein CUJ83_07935 n=1 Tax=Methanooceanicella nereidis TaxID=2052831 RepID=A0AAP2W7C0_9EURY|nr:transcriptional regulator [Methanocella sp. CWC-04]MCD1294926.1 transcriptional regulator [Methanocella sp. CWC-04]
MTRETLLDRVISLLQKAEFILSEKCDIRPRSFDLGARRGKTFLLIKVLSNIEGLGEETSLEMRRLAVLFSGSPIIIGEHTNDHPLESGAVYLRYGIPCINIETLHDFFVEEVPPLVYAAPGGLYVEIDGDTLKAIREVKGISLGDMSKQLGVSRRTISKYESGMNATIEIALRLEEILDSPIARPINILITLDKARQEQNQPNDLRKANPLERDALSALMNIGFEVYHTTRAPFNALSRDDYNKMLTGVSDYTEVMLKKAKFMSSLASVAGTYSLFIVDGMRHPKQIGNTLLIMREDLKDINDTEDLFTIFGEKMDPDKSNN